MSTRVAIVEDDRAVRENLGVLIEGTPGYRCVAVCPSAEDACERLPALRPDVILMDINLPGRNGIACVAKLRPQLPQTQIIMLTIEEDSEQVFDSMKAGATGYLVKHSTPEEILFAVAEVHRGGAPMSSHIARKVVTTFRQPDDQDSAATKLSPREEEVLTLLARGHRSKEIASELQIGLGTVNTYVRNIYDKLHVRSRAEAVARYLAR